MRVVASNQLTLELQPGIRQRFTSLRECLHWTVLNDPRGIKRPSLPTAISASPSCRAGCTRVTTTRAVATLT